VAEDSKIPEASEEVPASETTEKSKTKAEASEEPEKEKKKKPKKA
jgi:hypothetical protein